MTYHERQYELAVIASQKLREHRETEVQLMAERQTMYELTKKEVERGRRKEAALLEWEIWKGF